MIFDKLENSNLYTGMDGRIIRALDFLQKTDLVNSPEGRQDIDGDNIYALINDYVTKDASEAKPEAHIKYIDVQYVVSGCEYLGYAILNGQKPCKEYDYEKDYMLFDTDVSFLKFEAGMFAVLFPNDLHMPGIKYNEKSKVRKVVIKVKIGA